jgi:hypothetical protein
MTRRRSGTSTRSVYSVSVSMNALRGAYCVQPPRFRLSPLAGATIVDVLLATTR